MAFLSILYFADMKSVLVIIWVLQSPELLPSLSAYQKGYAFQQEDQMDSAIYYYNQALNDIDIETGDRAGILINLSILRKNKGQYDLALENAFDALQFTTDSTRSRSSALNSIATIYYLTGDYKRALDYYLKTLSIRKSISYQKGIAISLNNISNVFIAVEEFDSAVVYLQRALHIRSNMNDEKGVARLHNNLGLVYLKQENYDLAEYHLETALNLKLQNPSSPSISHTIRLQGVLFMKQGELNKAKLQLDRALVLSEKHQLRKVRKQVLADLAQYFELVNDSQQQAKILKQYILLSDSLLNEEKTKALTEMQVKYESDQKDQEISYLGALEQLQKIEITRQKNLAIGGFSAALVLLLLGGITVYYYQKARKEKQQKELLHHDMKHRVSNHLQLLISLLKMQRVEVQESATVEILRSLESRMAAMALVHQKLFSREEEMTLEIQSYFEELTNLLQMSFQSIRPLSIVAKIDRARVDVNLVIYLGLMVNELVTNAVKHAFHANSGEAKIQIVLVTKSNGLFLEVRDNGSGIKKQQKTDSFGSHLVRLLSKQIDAEYSQFNQNGAVFQFSIPLKHETGNPHRRR